MPTTARSPSRRRRGLPPGTRLAVAAQPATGGPRRARPVLTRARGPYGTVDGATVLAEGRILSWSEDATLRLWKADGEPLATLAGHTDGDRATQLPDGRILSWVAGGWGGNRTLRLWAAEGAPLAELHGHTDWVEGATVLRRRPPPVVVGTMAPCGCGQRTARRWPRSRGTPTRYAAPWYFPRAGSCRGLWSTLRLWKPHSAPLATLDRADPGETRGRRSSPRPHPPVAWPDPPAVGGGQRDPRQPGGARPSRAPGAADGRILSWSGDHTLRLWGVDGAPLATLEGHTGAVWGATVLPDGRILSWSRDGTLRLWADDGAPLATLRGIPVGSGATCCRTAASCRGRGTALCACGRLTAHASPTSEGTPTG